MRETLRRRRGPMAGARIELLREHTAMDERGAVRSMQAALVTLPEAAVDELWTPLYLERLARSYWKFLSRATLGLIRVAYTDDERYVVLLGRPLILMSFRRPEYELDDAHGRVRWRIRSGVLVDRRSHQGDGYLEIELWRRPCEEPGRGAVEIEVDVANFYPSIASWFTRGLYSATQSRIHVLVTLSFLRSLGTLGLERSPVARFDPSGRHNALPDAGWRSIAAAIGAAVTAVLAVRLARRRR